MHFRTAFLALTLVLTAPLATAAEAVETFAGKSGIALIDDYGSAAQELATEALSYLGIRYRYGGDSPETGLDCSGLVQNVFRNALGLDLPRTAAQMATVGDKVDRQELKPGDLVFFNTMRRAFSHVGIYLGEGRFVHAPSSGGRVRVENMNIRYWANRFNGGRRLLDDPSADTAFSTAGLLR